MGRIGGTNGIVRTEIQRYLNEGKLVNITEMIVWLKSRGYVFNRYTLELRCKNMNAKFE